MNAAEVRAFLARHGLAPRRDLGQNFLIDRQLAEKLAVTSGVTAKDTALEIGTGLGILTRELAARAARVLTLEVDAGLVRALTAEGLLPDGVELVHADALRIDLGRLVRDLAPPVRVVANLPYAVASLLLRRLLELRDALCDWSVMVQRELALRLLAGPGSADYSSLGILHQLTVGIERVMDLRPGCFYPVPRVSSSFLRITPRLPDPLGPGELERVERVVRRAFAQRRKTLVNALASEAGGAGISRDALAGVLARRGIDRRARAEALPPEDWLHVVRALADIEAEHG